MGRRILLTAAILGGVVLGTVGGHATVSGMRADATVTQRMAGSFEAMDSWNDGLSAMAPDDLTTPVALGNAPDSSDWTLGYRWAEQRELHHASACAIDSWSFQRGCEAAIRDRALIST